MSFKSNIKTIIGVNVVYKLQYNYQKDLSIGLLLMSLFYDNIIKKILEVWQMCGLEDLKRREFLKMMEKPQLHVRED